MKKETLEEVKDRRYPLTNIMHLQLNTAIRTGFEEGAKWQQERSYSEDDLIEAIHESRMQNDKSEDYIFKQFKKK